jgi:hypothetical protein
MTDITFTVAVTMSMVVNISPSDGLTKEAVIDEVIHRLPDLAVEDLIDSIELIAVRPEGGVEHSIEL